MQRIGFVGLLDIDFPGHAVRLCEGGAFAWNGDDYTSVDPVFGSVGALENLSEGVDEEVPVLEIKMLPPGTTRSGDLSKPGFQTSAVRFRLAEYDADTGQIVGMPQMLFLGQIDQTTIETGERSRVASYSVVSATARLIERNIGNSLNPVFHKSVWPGETGQDNATALGKSIAWGVEAPAAIGATFNAGGGAWWSGGQQVRNV